MNKNRPAGNQIFASLAGARSINQDRIASVKREPDKENIGGCLNCGHLMRQTPGKNHAIALEYSLRL